MITQIRFSTRYMSSARSVIGTLSLLALLANSAGITSQGQASKRSLIISALRIMPPDGSAFLVNQRFDIRVEAQPGTSGALRVLLDGRDITDWNNRNRLTGRQLDDTSPGTPAAAFLSRDWSFPEGGRHS